MYLKRKAMPRTWPIPRKGTAYVIKSSEKTLPLIVILRDILKIVRTKKETKRIMNDNEAFVDGKARKEIGYSAGIFSIISLPRIKKFYRVEMEKDKLRVHEIKEADSNLKPCKIIGKKTLKGKTQQFNLNDGRNLLSNEKFKVNGSLLIRLKDNKITKHLPLEKGASVLVIGGKNMGSSGKITEVSEKIKIRSDEKILNISLKNIYVVEK